MNSMTAAPFAIAALLAAISLPSAGMAEDAPERGAAMLQMWDSDGDGTVTLAEVQMRRADIFSAFDANGDDLLTAEEMALMDDMRAMQQEEIARGGQRQGQGKASGKGQGDNHGMGGGPITRADFVGSSADWLAKKDRNGDGVITAAEFAG